MGFIIQSYSRLIAGFEAAKKALIKEHIGDEKERKWEELRKLLPQPRQHESHFIDLSIELTEEMYHEQARILHCLLILEMCVIAKTYSESIFDAIKPTSKTRNGYTGLIDKGSSYFCSLHDAVGISDDNELKFKDVISFMETAKNFIETQIYVEGYPNKGIRFNDETGKEDHPFAQIEGLNLTYYLKICLDNIKFSEKLKADSDLECAITFAKETHKITIQMATEKHGIAVDLTYAVN
ncbi:MAG: hypothetical protein H0U73_06700 [Tatlockia sp.]|nr:hypothetical protein [Tatlockia sp.]